MSRCDSYVEVHVPRQLRGILRKYSHLVTLHGYKSLCALMQSMNLNQFAHRVEGEVHLGLLAAAGTGCQSLNSRTCPSRDQIAAYVACLKKSWPKDVGPDARTRNVFVSLLHDCLVLYFRVYCGGKDGTLVADKKNLVHFLENMRAYFCSYAPCGRGGSSAPPASADLGEEQVAFVDDENDEEIYQRTVTDDDSVAGPALQGPSPGPSPGPSWAPGPAPAPPEEKSFLETYRWHLVGLLACLLVTLIAYYVMTREAY